MARTQLLQDIVVKPLRSFQFWKAKRAYFSRATNIAAMTSLANHQNILPALNCFTLITANSYINFSTLSNQYSSKSKTLHTKIGPVKDCFNQCSWYSEMHESHKYGAVSRPRYIYILEYFHYKFYHLFISFIQKISWAKDETIVSNKTF